MLISAGFLHPSLLPKTTTDISLQPFTVPQTLILRKHSKYTKSFIRSSAADTHSRTLPHSAIHRIADKLRSLGFAETPTSKTEPESKVEENSAGEIFIPLPEKLPKHRVGHTLDPSWSTPENPVPEPGSGTWIARVNEVKGEVKKHRELEKVLGKKEEKLPTLAELKLSKEEHRRLQTVGIRLKKKLKIGNAGITEGIVNGIHERWRNEEVVKIVCEDLCRVNMSNTHNLLERKTGGLVVWRSGSKILLYRGADYKYPYFHYKNSTNETSTDALATPHMDYERSSENEYCSSSMDGVTSAGPSSTEKRTRPALIQGVGVPNRVRFQLPGEAEIAEEADVLIDGLGPRFTDWWGYDPQPVDADLLPAIIPGYRRPFRLLPYGVYPKLTGDEMTILRRLGRPLPCHFALGRNRKLQGLAAAIIKLWEKCEVAKIAVKRGVQNTNSEMMAEELKWLTGGTLITRDREFIVLYRGKDFLPPAVSLAIEQRRILEMQTEKRMTEHFKPVRTAQEFNVRNAENGSEGEVGEANTIILEQTKKRSTEATIKTTSLKLSMALEKKAKAEKLLAELAKAECSRQQEIDKEGITEEERYMLRRVGLRMKPFLLMGRRGVFDGTVENMHLHWKYRELVKIICKEKSTESIHQAARSLETESGGILVAVERVNKGYAIIMYRGKNYTRPSRLRPSTLLSKRQAMKRSLEAQRRESLKLHVLKLTRNISELKHQLDKDMETPNMQSIDESTSQLLKEEMSSTQAAEYVQSDIELMTSHQSSSELPEVVEVNDKHVADSTSLDLNDGVNVTFESLEDTQQDETNAASMCDGTEISKAEPSFSCQSISKEMHLEGMKHPAIGDAQHHGSDNSAMFSSDELTGSKKEPLLSAIEKNKSMEAKLIEIPSTSVRLSNRERLILRKQALMMKRCPPFAVGRSNIVTGVAKSIKFHFQRHPLAIVNVKGRAKGTSVQEVVFELEKATGGVLVSHEPSKVILYRGWGAGDESEHKKRNANDVWRTSVNGKRGIQPAISSELLAAIRLEVGLQSKEELKANPGTSAATVYPVQSSTT